MFRIFINVIEREERERSEEREKEVEEREREREKKMNVLLLVLDTLLTFHVLTSLLKTNALWNT